MRTIAHIIPARVGFTQTTATMGTASASVVAANATRVYLLIQNISDTDVYLDFAGGTAATTSGVLIAASGGYYESPGGVVPTGAVTGISTGASKTLVVVEG